MNARLVKWLREKGDKVKTIFAPQEPPERYANVQKSGAYSAPFFEIDPTAIDDLVVYLKNIGIPPIMIHRVTVVAAAAGGIQLLQKVTGTAGGGGATGVCVNKDLSNSNTYADNISFLTDPDITGLTEVATIDTFGQITGEENTHNYPEGIILRQGDAVAIGVAVATTVISGNIHFVVLPEGALAD